MAGEQMRMWGGWKGLPLPASHWPGMTTFSPEAPSPPPAPPPSTLLSILIPPPSIHLRSPPSPALRPPSSSQQEPELISASIPGTQEKAHSFLVWSLFLFFPPHLFLRPLMDVDSELLLSVASFSPPSFASFFSASACPASTLAGYIFLQHAASLRRADLCNGAAPASCQLLASQRDGGKQMVWWRKPGRSWEGEYKEAECRKTAWFFFFFFFLSFASDQLLSIIIIITRDSSSSSSSVHAH